MLRDQVLPDAIDAAVRVIDTHIDGSFVRGQLKGSYGDTGHPSLDPELQLLRAVLNGYLAQSARY